MQFNNISDWKAWPQDDLLEFTVRQKTRTVHIKVNTAARCELWLVFAEKPPVFVASVDGVQELRFAISETAALQVMRDDHDPQSGEVRKVPVFFWTADRSQTKERPDAAAFTEVAPRPRQNSEFAQVYELMRRNMLETASLREAQARSDAELRAVQGARAALEAELAGVKASIPAPSPVPEMGVSGPIPSADVADASSEVPQETSTEGGD